MMKSFTVRRQEPVLIPPAMPTPHETKPLSDIDDQEALRLQMPNIFFYKRKITKGDVEDEDPVKVIKKALAKTLVFYYPFAGRVREGPGRKLMVECTGEGVLFIEADADVTLEEFGEEIRPPFRCVDELSFNVPGSDGILHTPLLLVQVTRLQCGGFILTVRLNHTMSDATGFVQFLLAVAEIAKGAPAPSTLPVWKRELLNARDPPRVTYENIVPNYPKETIVQIVCVSLFFGPAEMAALKTFLPHHLKNKCTEFEVLTAFLWRCRAIALQPDQDREVKLVFFANGRPKFDPPLPKGYYGNVLAVPVAQTTARELMENPLGYAAELVMKAKSVVSEEYVRSTADMNVSRGRRRSITLEPRSMFLVSDLTRVGFAEVDFGWGNPVYYGVPIGDDKNEIHATSCNYSRTKNKQGEEGVLVPICLPKLAMKSFVQLMKKFIMMNIVWDDGDHNDEGDHVVIKFRKFRSLL